MESRHISRALRASAAAGIAALVLTGGGQAHAQPAPISAERPAPRVEAGRTQVPRRKLWGYLGPGIASTIIGAGLTIAAGAAAAPDAFACNGIEGPGERAVCHESYPGSGFAYLAFITMLPIGLGHLAAGIPLIVKGAIGAEVRSSVEPSRTIEPMIGTQLGIRGTF